MDFSLKRKKGKKKKKEEIGRLHKFQTYHCQLFPQVKPKHGAFFNAGTNGFEKKIVMQRALIFFIRKNNFPTFQTHQCYLFSQLVYNL